MKREFTFEDSVEREYLLALIDVAYGTTVNELEDELIEHEKKENYEVCEGLRLAIDFCDKKTIADLKKEIVSLTELINNKKNNNEY